MVFRIDFNRLQEFSNDEHVGNLERLGHCDR